MPLTAQLKGTCTTCRKCGETVALFQIGMMKREIWGHLQTGFPVVGCARR